jgi:hypothetical protein
MELMIVCGLLVRRRVADAPKRPNQLIKQGQRGGQTTLMTTGFAPDRETVYLPAP